MGKPLKNLDFKDVFDNDNDLYMSMFNIVLAEYKNINQKFEELYLQEKADKEKLISEKEEEKYELKKEIARLKNRGLISRILNI